MCDDHALRETRTIALRSPNEHITKLIWQSLAFLLLIGLAGGAMCDMNGAPLPLPLLPPPPLDTDGDGILDDDEIALGLNPSDPDTDHDQLDDASELILFGTDPLNDDTDGDGVSDGDEVAAGLDPLSNDTDGDGLTDGDEVAAGLDPLSNDTDGDGVSDGNERSCGTDPLDDDSDDDGLTDGEEKFVHFSDPKTVDTDGDTLSDGDEVFLFGTNPLLKDSDFDSIDDPDELLVFGTDPTLSDTDFDGLLDGTEIDPLFGSDPLNPDTDGDLIFDGAEVRLSLDLLIPNAIGSVSAVYCDDFARMFNLPQAGDFGVFENESFFDDFSTWLPGDFVAMSASGNRLANLSIDESISVDWQGNRLLEDQISSISLGGQDIQLLGGTLWFVTLFDQFNVILWLTFHDVVVTALPGGLFRMINTDRCESISVF